MSFPLKQKQNTVTPQTLLCRIVFHHNTIENHHKRGELLAVTQLTQQWPTMYLVNIAKPDNSLWWFKAHSKRWPAASVDERTEAKRWHDVAPLQWIFIVGNFRGRQLIVTFLDDSVHDETLIRIDVSAVAKQKQRQSGEIIISQSKDVQIARRTGWLSTHHLH